jgi:hypothetical protein
MNASLRPRDFGPEFFATLALGAVALTAALLLTGVL